MIRFTVEGHPKGQPRARAFAFKGRARMYDPGTAEGWKSCVAAAARPHLPATPLEGPIRLYLSFRFERPKSHFTKKGKRPDAPTYVAKKPDADNAAKAVMDALTQLGAWRDDAQVVILEIWKVYATECKPGCDVAIEGLPVTYGAKEAT